MSSVNRTPSDRGVVGMIDLEALRLHQGQSHALIHATEKTVVLERIPPRVQIRKDAPLEMPHILLLIDDPALSVIEPLSDQKDGYDRAYSFELMKKGGHIDGWFLPESAQEAVQNALEALIADQDDKLLFAVGDGNHSLATAKECYNLTKNPLARYALVEIVNIHDKSIEFEPIYRVLFNIDQEDFLSKFIARTEAEGGDTTQRFEVIDKNAQRSERQGDRKAASSAPCKPSSTII